MRHTRHTSQANQKCGNFNVMSGLNLYEKYAPFYFNVMSGLNLYETYAPFHFNVMSGLNLYETYAPFYDGRLAHLDDVTTDYIRYLNYMLLICYLNVQLSKL